MATAELTPHELEVADKVTAAVKEFLTHPSMIARRSPLRPTLGYVTLTTDEMKSPFTEHQIEEKSGFLEKCKIGVLTRTRKPGEKFFFRMTKTYFQYHESASSSVAKRSEVRMKIVRVVSTKGCGFDVHFRNGSVWHLLASNLVDKIEWMEAIMPGSSQAGSRVSISTPEWIDGPEPIAPVKTNAQPTEDVSTEISHDCTVVTVPDCPISERRRLSSPLTRTYECGEDPKSDFSLDEDGDLLEQVLDEAAAMAPPPLPPDDPSTNTSERVRPPMERMDSEYLDPSDETNYAHAQYEEHTLAGMAQEALVEIKQYAVLNQTVSHLKLPPEPTDSKKFLLVAKEDTTALSEGLRTSSKVIDPKQLNVAHQLGKGNFGAVHLATWTFRDNCQPVEVAVKSLKPQADEKSQKDFLAEARIMAEFDHPNIVRLFGVVDELDTTTPRIVTEYMANGSLKDFLLRVRVHDPQLRSVAQLLQYLVDIAAGLHYMATEGFVHRDMAARNVLVSEDERCKITDFGLSRKLEEDQEEYMSTGGLLPLKWCAPEAGMHKCFTTASDVWGFGVTMWEVMTYGKKPYASLTFFNLFPELQRGVRLGKPLGCSDELYDLMKKCWEWERGDRPTTDAICCQLQRLLMEVIKDNRDREDDSEDEASPDSEA